MIMTRELDKLSKEKVNMSETLEFMHLHNLKVIEYRNPAKEIFSNISVLDSILSDIWETFAELSSKTSLRFQRMKMLSETDQVDLVCAYIVAKSDAGQSEHSAEAHSAADDGDRQYSRESHRGQETAGKV